MQLQMEKDQFSFEKLVSFSVMCFMISSKTLSLIFSYLSATGCGCFNLKASIGRVSQKLMVLSLFWDVVFYGGIGGGKRGEEEKMVPFQGSEEDEGESKEEQWQ